MGGVCSKQGPREPEPVRVGLDAFNEVVDRAKAAEAKAEELREALTQAETKICQLEEAVRRTQAENTTLRNRMGALVSKDRAGQKTVYLLKREIDRLREQIIKLNAELQYGRISFEDERNERKLGVEIAIQGRTTLTHQHCDIEITKHRGFTHQISINIPISNPDIRLRYQESWNDAHLKTALLNKISTIIRGQAKSNSPAEYAPEIEAAVTEILLSTITNLKGSHPALTDRPRTRANRPMLPWHSTSPRTVSPPPAGKLPRRPAVQPVAPPKVPPLSVPLHGLAAGLPGAVVAVDPPSPPGSPTSSSWDTLPVARARMSGATFSKIVQSQPK